MFSFVKTRTAASVTSALPFSEGEGGGRRGRGGERERREGLPAAGIPAGMPNVIHYFYLISKNGLAWFIFRGNRGTYGGNARWSSESWPGIPHLSPAFSIRVRIPAGIPAVVVVVGHFYSQIPSTSESRTMIIG